MENGFLKIRSMWEDAVLVIYKEGRTQFYITALEPIRLSGLKIQKFASEPRERRTLSPDNIKQGRTKILLAP